MKDYLTILEYLLDITKSHPHLVTAIGLCNFDSDHTEEACIHLLQKRGEVGIVSNQIQVSISSVACSSSLLLKTVQYSLIDSRPSLKMEAVCQQFGVKLLTYGSLVSEPNNLPSHSCHSCGTQCGGFLSRGWLGKEAPEIYSDQFKLTPSQRKVPPFNLFLAR